MSGMMGQRILRVEDDRFLRGRGLYVENQDVAGVLHATFVRSPVAHARIVGIDTSAVSTVPGAQVFVAADVELDAFPPPPVPGVEARMVRPFLASDVVRFVGDIVAVVLTETRVEGADAAELVMVDYEPLPAVVDPEEALTGSVLLFPELGTNVCASHPVEAPDEALFDGCDAVVSGRLVSQRLAACPLEARGCVAACGEDGRMTLWLSTQTPHLDRHVLGLFLGLGDEGVRVVAPDVGGGFGAKGLSVETVIVPWLARKTGRPVRWTESRGENMIAMQHGRAAVLEFTIGGNRDGEVKAYRLRVVQDAGAYPGIGAILPGFTALMSSGVYAIPTIEADTVSVVTNTTPTGPFRGAGRPEATQAIERAMDLFAAEIGLDPAEVRRRNLIAADAFPMTTASGAGYDSGDYGRALDLALDHSGYQALREEQRRRRESGNRRALGIGVSVYVEITNGLVEPELGEVEITPDGAAILRTGSFSHGQGHETTFAMIVADRLGIPVESVRVIKGDTDEVSQGAGTYGSKSTQIGGSAARVAADVVVARARVLAAEHLEAGADDVVLDVGSGSFHVAGSPTPALSWKELAAAVDAQGRLEELRAAEVFKADAPTFPFGAHVAVVEVDTETGEVDLRRLVAVDDAGNLVNPLIAEGQVHGGVAAGVGQALFEEFVYDEEGNPLTASFLGYAFPSAAELPSWDLVEMETPTPLNALGAKGIGESGTVGSTPAVQSAVADALAPLGVRHVEMPANGERVWRAIQDARASG
jgi:aerobic carbon-monoxide dehydrogenase large subunit